MVFTQTDGRGNTTTTVTSLSQSNMFSDPSKDFQDEESQKILLRISSTPISQLQADDYIIIFQEPRACYVNEN